MAQLMGGYSTEASRIKRQREYADALRKQAMEPLQAIQMPAVSGPLGTIAGLKVQPSGWDYANQALRAGIAGYQSSELDKEEAANNARAQAEAQQALKNFPQMTAMRDMTTTTPGAEVPVEQAPIQQQANSPFGTTEAAPVTPGTMLPQARAQFQAGAPVTTTTQQQVDLSPEEYAANLSKFTSELPVDNPYTATIREHALKQTLDMPTKIMERRDAAELAANTASIAAKEKYDFQRQLAEQNHQARLAQLTSVDERATADRAFRADQAQQQRDFLASQAKLYKMTAPQQIAAKAATAGGGTIPPEMQDSADLIAGRFLAGDKNALVGFGRDKAMLRAIHSSISRQAKMQGVDSIELVQRGLEYGSTAAEQRRIGERAAAVRIASNEAKKMLPIMLAESASVDRTQYPTLNSITNAFDKGTGGQNIVRLNAAMNAVINSYARAISPTGTPTVSDKDHAREVISSAYSDGQLQNIANIMDQEITASLAAPQEARAQSREERTGKAPSALPGAKGGLTNAEQDELTRLKAKHGGATSADIPQ